jgi:plasmid stabilization system protein ParE
MRVRYTAAAQADIDAIFGYVTEHNPAAAQRLKARLNERAERLSRFPHLGQETDQPGIRALVDSRHPYLIFYTVERAEIVILHVRHAARKRP